MPGRRATSALRDRGAPGRRSALTGLRSALAAGPWHTPLGTRRRHVPHSQPSPQADDPKSKELVAELQVKTIPTVQFIKNKQLLWEHKGIDKLEQNLSEGGEAV